MKRFAVLAGVLVALMTSAAMSQDFKGAVTGAMKSAGGGATKQNLLDHSLLLQLMQLVLR